MKKVREGYKMTELGEIPEEWKIKKLNSIGEIVTGSTPKTSEKDNYGDKYLWVSPGDLGSKKYITSTEKMLSDKGFNKTRKLPSGAILVTCIGSTIGKMGISKIELSTNQQINSIICNKHVNNEFIYYALNYNFNGYASFISTQAVPIINKTTFGEFSIQIPSIQEQNKIALILSTVDEQIDNVDELIKKNKELKKGLMQQLLTKGIGHTKFKKTEIGEIPEEWEVATLGNISRNKGEYGIGASASEFIEGKPRYLRITDIGDECNLLFNDIKGLNDEEYDKYLLSIGDIVFARTGNTTGKAYVYDDNHGELVYAGFLIKFSINIDVCKANFIKYVIQTKRYWDWVGVMSTRSGQPGINSNEYSSFCVQVPSIEEQEKILSILSEVDKKIEIYENKKQKLDELKKGLMQQLLTGAIRVL